MTPLNNPIWHALTTRHSGIAIGAGSVRRYPGQTAPFAAACEASEEAAGALDAMVEPGEKIGVLNVIPPLGWPVAREIEIHQYVWEDGAAEREPDAVKLGDEHIPAMLELAALVYPAYFRAETAKLGDYFGLFDEGGLVAMAGIRFSLDGFQEISAICTHPDYRGRGLAARLTRHLARQILDEGDIPFLHTESDNPAKALYEKVGFTLRAALPFRVFEKAG